MTVTFSAGEHGELSGTTSYYVNPEATQVELKAPTVKAKTGYKFSKWNHELSGQFKSDTTITAQYEQLDNVITNDGHHEKPAGYVTVTFSAGEHGELSGTTSYYVNPEATQVELKAPTVKAKTGYKFSKWNHELSGQFKSDTTITAQYEQLDNVITNDGHHEKPAGYVTVTFSAGEHGELSGTTSYYVNPEATQVELKAPTVKAKTGYKFSKWNHELSGQFKSDTTITAQYEQLDNVITNDGHHEKPAGYVTVTFSAGEHGELSGTTSYYVNPEATQVELKAPTVKAKTGYKFSKWNHELSGQFKSDTTITAQYEQLDNVITNDGHHEKPAGYVTVTFSAGEHGELSGTTSYYVNPEATQVELKAPTVKAKTGYKFSKWNHELSGQFKSDTTITAQYEQLDNVITNDGHHEKPAGYVTVTFSAGEHGELSGTTSYYVNPEATQVELKAPTVKAKTGYKFSKWNHELSGQFKSDTTITAQYEQLDNVITNDGHHEKPAGYVTVTFSAGEHGELSGTTSYYVNPEATQVELKAPTVKAKTGYKFSKWNHELSGQFKSDTTITAQYEQLDNVITNDGHHEKPAGYVTVTFSAGEHGELSGTTSYYVNPEATQVELKAPTVKAKTGYKFSKWNHELSGQFKSDTTITAQYEQLDNVITNDGHHEKPAGYVTVTFSAGEHGELSGTTSYYVNPEATQVELKAPTVKAKTGYKFSKWNHELSGQFKSDTTITAQYEQLDNVITNDGHHEKPAGYVTVTFSAGEHGELSGTTSYYVNPEATQVELKAPTVKAKTGYKFSKWNHELSGQFKSDTTITAQYEQLDNVITNDGHHEKPAGYVTVTFSAGEHGELSGTTSYYVNPEATQVELKAPTVKAKTGYKFSKWNHELSGQFKSDTTITAQYEQLDNVITNDGHHEKPAGYVTVTFSAGEHGELSGTTSYYVNPEATQVELKAPTVKAKTGYKFSKWNHELSGQFKSDTTITAQYEQLDNVITNDGHHEKPAGYVTVTFSAGEHGELSGTTSYYVNPEATQVELKAPTVKAKTGYKFSKWNHELSGQFKSDTTITAQYEQLDNVITNDGHHEKPAGYVTVTFSAGEHGELSGTTSYYVNPEATQVELKAPTVKAKTGYKFSKWNHELSGQFKSDTTITAQYEQLDNVITNDGHHEKPAGYVTVTFSAGEHGELSGTTSYYVNPEATQVELKAPTVKAKTGYKFSKWNHELSGQFKSDTTITAQYEQLDNVITNDGHHEKPAGYVTVTFSAGEHGELSGTTSYYVNPEATQVELKAPTVKAKTGYKFSKWNHELSGQFKSDTTITAQYEQLDNVITNDGHHEKPAGYVTVTFSAGEHGELSGTTSYYVNPEATQVELKAPTVKAKTGYKFSKWNHELSGQFKSDTTITAQYEQLDNVITNDGHHEKPAGYVTVTFSAGEHGELSGTTSYYVNPEATQVELKAPTVKAKTGYKFSKWNHELSGQFKSDTTITAQYEQLDNVITNDGHHEKPAGYVTVTFSAGEHGELSGTTSYYVNPEATQVELKAPTVKAKTGYKFSKWNHELSGQFKSDTTITAQYEQLDNVITNDGHHEKPAGYVTVTFSAGEHGELSGTTSYYVNPEATQVELKAPTVKAKTGYKFSKWNHELSGQFKSDTTITAQYEQLDNVITNDGHHEKPAGYVTVTFSAGEHGELSGTTSYYVNPEATQVELKAPTVKAKTGYKFSKWNHELSGQFKSDTTITAQYEQLDNVITNDGHHEKPAGYVTVTFSAGEHGELSGTTSYYVNPEATQVELKAPTVKAKTGYKFSKWNHELSGQFKSDTTITAQYEQLDNVITNDGHHEKPAGYVTVTFSAGEHGELSGTTSYYVNPEATQVELKAPTVKAKTGYKFSKWNHELSGQFKSDTTITAQYEQLDNVITNDGHHEKPAGYVTVTFSAGEHGELSGTTSYYVNPEATQVELKAPTVKAKTGYKFSKWNHELSGQFKSDTTITAQYEQLDNVITNDGHHEKPAGYVTVTFSAGEHGELSGTTSYYVNPEATQVELKAPTVKAKTGYKFSKWNHELSGQFKSDTTITAQYEQLDNVITNDGHHEKPAGYVTVTFSAGEHGELSGTTSYYVNPEATQVELKAPTVKAKTGYKFSKWNHELSGQFKSDTTITAQYEQLDNVITNDGHHEKPAGYVTVTFSAGEHGELSGTTSYYVNPEATQVELKAPTVKAKTGYKFSKWNHELSGQFKSDTTITAQYEQLDNVITNDGHHEKPAGYVTVTFSAGEHGELSGTTSYYVNPEATQVELKAPTVKAKTGYKFSKWNHELSGQFKSDTTITAQYEQLDNVITNDGHHEKPAGYVTVTFSAGEHGELSGTTSYYVNPEATQVELKAPTVKAKTGYKFSKWNHELSGQFKSDTTITAQYEQLDNVITNDGHHEKPAGYVTVTFSAGEHGELSGTTSYYVNPEATQVELKAPTVKAKTGYKFSKWNHELSGQFKSDTTITAQYEQLDNVITNDGHHEKPAGYVTVTFSAGEHGELSGTTSYYVNPEATQVELKAPTVKAKTGYKFSKWNHELSGQFKSDTTITAQYEQLDNVITNDGHHEKPAGYVTVTFSAGEHGELSGTTSYYVNPEATQVELKAPTVKAKTGYKFSKWNHELSGQFKSDTTITAQYEQLDNVITNDGHHEKPAGYVTVTFSAGEHGELSGTTSYYVNPEATQVELKAPTVKAKTGYKFSKWNHELSGQFKSDTTITAQYEQLDNVITNDGHHEKPAGYVTVTFSAGEHGELSGTTSYYVNPEATQVELKAPTVKAKTGYKFSKWNHELSGQFKSDTTITAQYEQLDNVITNDGHHEKPAGYVTVTFSAGEHGELSGTTSYYVNPEATQVELKAPTVKAKTGYKFSKWNHELSGQFKSDTTITAQYEQLDNVITNDGHHEKPAGYVTVTFSAGEHGELSGTTSYYVNPEATQVELKAPTVKAKTGYKFSKWNHELSGQFKSDTTITAQYEQLDNVITNDGHHEKPAGYVTVTFSAGEHGELSGTTSYYVNPEATQVELKAPTVKAKTGYKFSKWNHELSGQFKSDTTITAQYEQLDNVITNDGHHEKPAGYVTVTFSAGEHGELSGTTSYYVNPEATQVELKAPTVKAKTGYKFSKWNHELSGQFKSDTTITAQYEQLDNVITNDGHHEKPAGYVTVTFSAGEHGELSGTTSYYVNPEATQVELKAPTVKAKTGYKFSKWNHELSGQFKSDTTITAQYEQLDNVITNDGHHEKPAGYVTVTFSAGEHGELSGTTSYYVNPEATQVELKAPTVKAKTGYKFSKWNHELSGQFKSDTTITAQYEQLDNVITNDGHHEKPAGYVTVTFSAGEHGELSGTTSYYVNPEATQVELKAPTVKAKTGYKFSKWNHELSGQFKSDTTITAQYEQLDNVITNDGHHEKPAGYVTVTFSAGEHGELSGTTSYYVNPEATQVELKAPTVKAKTGYKFSKWNHELSGQFKSDTTITAQYEQLDNVITNDGHHEKPAGYVTVTFSAGEHGELSGTTSYYVNPEATQVELKAPTVKAKTGYKFSKWNHELSGQFKSDTTITAQYEQLDNVITNDGHHEKPAGYVTVTFSAGEHGELSGTTSYYVNPEATQVELKAPTVKAKTGYKFSKWNHELSGQFKSDTTITAQYEQLDNVITNDGHHEKPAGYVTVTFSAGEHGELSGTTSYYVNPEATQVELKAPTVKAKTGYKFSKWNHELSGQFKSDTTITAQYEQLDNVITNDGHHEKPAGYVTVTFSAGEHGELSGTTSYYVNPEATQVELKAPTVKAKTGYKFSKWNHELSGQFKSDTTITAQYEQLDNVITNDGHHEKPAGYVTVTFSAGEHGELSGTTSYYVNPEATQVELKAPTVKAKTGYKFSKWNHELSGQFKSDTTITAQYEQLDNVITNDGHHEKPAGYVTVTFSAGEHGELSGTTSYYVNPEATQVELKAPTVKAKTGYKFSKWNHELSGQFKSDTTITAQYEQLDNVITNDGHHEKPAGYVTVTFSAGEHGELSGTTSYYVNPEATQVELKAPTVKAKTGYKFSKWNHELSGQFKSDTTITAQYEQLDNVITNDGHHEKPAGYVTVTFSAGEHGELSGTTSYYVNPEATQVELKAPTVKAKTGYKFSKWNHELSGQFKSDTTITAQYEQLDNVITNDGHHEKPAGYVTVTFSAGEHGELSGTTSYYVNPEATQVELKAPTVKAKTGYKFSKWNHELSGQFKSDTTITAQYEQLDNVITNDGHHEKPAGYVTVTFSAGEHGELSGTTSYYVNPEATQVELKAPTVKAKTGYKFSKWNHELSGQFKSDTTITAQYEQLDNVITNDSHHDKPIDNISNNDTIGNDLMNNTSDLNNEAKESLTANKPKDLSTTEKKTNSKITKRLPQTGEKENSVLGLLIIGLSGLLGIVDRKKRKDK
ncbi:InlB B-repeat-containing protein [Lactobacillus iners]|uniref:InlB B-repeat-containing protein n=4 Tax=Lactobacillus iners TaxID=147802 RepID=UPI003369F68C